MVLGSLEVGLGFLRGWRGVHVELVFNLSRGGVGFVATLFTVHVGLV